MDPSTARIDLSRLPCPLQPGEQRAAVDIGGTSVKLLILQADGAIEWLPTIPTGQRESGEVLNQIASLLAPYSPTTTGVGFPGIVDGKGEVVGSPNLPRWKGLSLVEELQKRMETTATAANDANAAALGESLFGGETTIDELLFLTLGTGVGSGIVTMGKIATGYNGFAGEGGHITVEPNGAKCGCGRRGCLEAHFSERALMREAQQHGLAAGTGAKAIIEMAQQNHPTATAILEKGLDHLAIGLSGMCALLAPQEVVLGGGISLAGEFLLQRLQPHLERRLQYPGYTLPTVRLSTLGAMAGLYGALAL